MEETAAAGWSGREGHQAISYRDRLYVLGGFDGGNKNDVWSSADGKDWSLVTVSANWSERLDHQAVIFPPQLELVGAGERLTITTGTGTDVHTFTAQYGVGEYTYSLDPAASGFVVSPGGVLSAGGNVSRGEHTLTVWVEDSRKDRAQTAVRVFAAYFNLAEVPHLEGFTGIGKVLHTFTTDGGIAGEEYMIVASNKEYFALDADSGVLSLLKIALAGVYTLSVEVSDSSSLSDKATAVATVEIKGRQIFVLGGYDGSRLNDVWSAADGANWERETASAGWARRDLHQALSHHGRLYILGGTDGGNRYNDVWSSADGANWERKTDDAEWSRRYGHQVLSHHGRLYVLGGYDGTNHLSDVWSSADGANWERETDSAGWARRRYHQALSHHGRLYVLGGYDGSDSLSDVWSSADGKNWERETDSAGWAGRENHQALSHHGRLYVLGGTDGSRYHDVWSSADGKNWVPATASAGWSKRYGHQAVVFPPELALLGVGDVITVTGAAEINLHTFTAQYGVGDYSYSLGVATDGFNVSPSGVLSADSGVATGKYILTIWVEDGEGSRAQTAVRVLVSYFNLAEVPRLFGLTGISDVLHMFTTDGGIPGEQYMMVAGNTPGYFALDADSGVLSLLTTALAGVYTLSVEVSDSLSSSRKATAAATVEINDRWLFILGGYEGNNLNDVWFSADGANWGRETDDAEWSRRYGHQALSHHGRLYVLGGASGTGFSYKNDVWSSANGKNWSLETDGAGWVGRSFYQALSHHGRLYVLGGNKAGDPLNDVWSSADGKNWVPETANAEWKGRRSYQALSHNGRLYVLGGRIKSSLVSDVWSSADGANWSQETANAGWSGRYGYQALSHHGRLYVLGGYGSSNSLTDVWSSADGKSWTLETAAAGWSRRSTYQALSHHGRLYVLGGIDDDNKRLNDVWSSADGKSWMLVTMTAGWSGREGHQAVVFPSPLVLFGVGEILTVSVGIETDLHTFTAQYGKGNYTYSLEGEIDGFSVSPSGVLSADGAVAGGLYTLTVWVEDSAKNREQTALRIFMPYVNLTEVPRLFGVSGISKVLHTLTTDGIIAGEQYTMVAGNEQEYFALDADSGVLSLLATAWAGVYTLSVEVSYSLYPARKATAVATVEIKSMLIFILGGDRGSQAGGIINDVWSSADGANWVSVTANAGWSGRENHQAVSHHGRLYVLGGVEGINYLNDVWSSADGANWSLETANAGWSGRENHQVLSYNGRLYVLGGEDDTNRLSDVWSSADGANWSLETSGTGWMQRSSHQALSHNGRLYVMGGYTSSRKNDVWWSTDGINWSRETANAGWAGRSRHQALSHNGRLYVLGGWAGSRKNDVWSSADGASWSLETANAGWAVREGHQALSHYGRLYVLGGLNSITNSLNDVWSSVDGANWSLETAGAGWARRDNHQAVVFLPE